MGWTGFQKIRNPNLAGQIENYLVKALMEYRSGERKTSR